MGKEFSPEFPWFESQPTYIRSKSQLSVCFARQITCFRRRILNLWYKNWTQCIVQEKYSLLQKLMRKSGGHSVIMWEAEAVTRRCPVKKVFLTILQNSLENTYARASFLIKLQAYAGNFIKKRPWDRCFLVSFVKFLRTPFLTDHFRWLPLEKLWYFCCWGLRVL